MKKSGKIIIGAFVAVVVVLVFSQFQNCSPTGSGSFNIGSSALTIAAIQIQPTPVSPGASYTATATMSTSTDTNVMCSWTITGTNGPYATYPPTAIQNGVCYLTGQTAPPSGTYSLTVTATDSSTNQTGTDTILFGTGGNQASNTQCAIVTYSTSCNNTVCPGSPVPATCSSNCASKSGYPQSKYAQDGNLADAGCNCVYVCQ
jgi:hypothetical protein